MTVKELATASGAKTGDVEEALAELESILEGRGLALVRERDRVALGTSLMAAVAIERMRRDELQGPVGRAGLETLAVVIYRGPLSRADIEYIRGVNATSILRTLMIRGLIERVENPGDKRSFLYRASTELPAYFGVSRLTDLPEFLTVRDELQAVMTERDSAVAEESAIEQ